MCRFRSLNWEFRWHTGMNLEIILRQTADKTDLLRQRQQLANLRSQLGEREAELAQVRGQLKAFEDRYFRQVGVLYAELDDLEARIAEREVALYDSDAARSRATEARQRADDTHDATFRAEEMEVAPFDPPQSLKALWRELAKRIHPDFARDDEESAYFTLLMARANQAYRRGDSDVLQRLLDDHREAHASLADDGDSADLLRIARQVQHVHRDLAALDEEQHTLRSSEIGQMHADAEAAASEHRDLLLELASGLRDQVAEAKRRFEFIDRQIDAHGR